MSLTLTNKQAKRYKKSISLYLGLLRDSFYMGLRSAISVVTGFFLNVMLARFLTVSDLGNYRLFHSVINILMIFSLTGLAIAVRKAGAKGYLYFFNKATKFSILYSLIASTVLIVLSFTAYSESDIQPLLGVTALLIPFYYGLNKWESYYTGCQKFKALFRRWVPVYISGVLLTVILLYYFRDWSLLIIAFLVHGVGWNTILFNEIRKELKKESPVPERDKEFMQYALRMSGINVFSLIAGNIEKIILAYVTSSATLGIYSIAYLLPQTISNGIKAILGVPIIKLASFSEKRNRQILKKKLGLLLLSGLLIFAVGWFVLPSVIRMFFGKKYVTAIFYSQLLLVSLVTLPAADFLTSLVVYQSKESTYAKLSIITQLLRIALFAVLVPIFHIYGIIFANICLQVIHFAILLIWFSSTNKKIGV